MTEKPDPSHNAQERENAEPEERIRPMPLAAVAVTLAMVLFGVVYIFVSEPFGNADLGDRRTVADLSGPAPAAAGAVVDGKAVFAAQCVACHQATGKGLPGVFPPLDGSEWVQGDARTAVLGRLKKMLPAIASFAVGCALAALAYMHWGMWCFAVPPLVALTAWVIGRRVH